MEDSFTLDILVDGQEQSFEGKLVSVGYTHKFHFMVNGLEVVYEPDEERNYRAIINEPTKLKERNSEIIKLIGRKLDLLK